MLLSQSHSEHSSMPAYTVRLTITINAYTLTTVNYYNQNKMQIETHIKQNE